MTSRLCRGGLLLTASAWPYFMGGVILRMEFHHSKYGLKAINKKQAALCARAGSTALPPKRRRDLQQLIAWLNGVIEEIAKKS